MSSTSKIFDRLGVTAFMAQVNESNKVFPVSSKEASSEPSKLALEPGMDMANVLQAALAPFNSKKPNPAS